MGRRLTDGEAIDVAAPAATLIEKGELYRIDGWSGFAMVEVLAADVDKNFAIEIGHGIWKVKVPAGTCATRGLFVKWTTAGTAFQKSSTDILDDTTTRTANSIGRVERVRNSAGYAAIRLLQSA